MEKINDITCDYWIKKNTIIHKGMPINMESFRDENKFDNADNGISETILKRGEEPSLKASKHKSNRNENVTTVSIIDIKIFRMEKVSTTIGKVLPKNALHLEKH